MARAQTCPRCGIENPPTFPACARCHVPFHTIDPSARTRGGVSSDEFASFGTQELALDEAIAAADRAVLGRDADVEAIAAATSRAFATNRPAIVVLEGPRGAGTSRLLLHTAHLAVTTDERVRFAHGTCMEGRDGELAPFSRILMDRFHLTPSSAELPARARVTTEVAEALGTSDAVAVSTTAHLVGHAAGLDFPDSPILRAASSSPEELRERSRQATARFFAADALHRPLWMGIDNALRLDEAAWSLIAAIAEQRAPIVLVLAGELGTVDAAYRALPPESVLARTLGPLGEREIDRMMHRLLPDLETVPEPLVAAVAHRSGGLPSEVRQLVFSLYETGLFVTRPDGTLGVDLGRMERGELPITMDDALLARLARLDADERRTLEHAAVCGEQFWDGALLCALRFESSQEPSGIDLADQELDAHALVAVLGRLVEKGFVIPEKGAGVVPADEYRFSTGRMRAIVYASMPEDLRRGRHLAVARWLDVAAAQRRDAVSATVGFHLELAGATAEAGVAYARAALSERSQRRYERSLRWLERAELCTPDHDPMARLDLAHERGAVLVSLGRIDEAIPAFERMHLLARRLGARAKQAAALDRIARAELARGAPTRALPLLERAIGLARMVQDRRGIASCLDDLAQVELVQGRIDRAHVAATEALEIRRALDDARGESVSLTTLGRIALRRGELSTAEERLRAALQIRESLNDVEGVIQTLTALGRVAFERTDRETALDLWQRALSLARELGDRRSEQTLLSHTGEACLVLGRLAAAEGTLAKAREIALALRDARAAARIDVMQGRVAMRRGDEKALRLLKLALDAAEAAEAPDVLGLAHRAIGQLHAQRAAKDPTALPIAERHLVASTTAFRLSRSDKEMARSLLDLAHVAGERGDVETARARAGEALVLLRDTQLPELELAERMTGARTMLSP